MWWACPKQVHNWSIVYASDEVARGLYKLWHGNRNSDDVIERQNTKREYFPGIYSPLEDSGQMKHSAGSAKTLQRLQY